MISTMQPGDVEEVAALLTLCFGSAAWSEQSVRSQLEKPGSVCLITKSDDRIVGYLAFEHIADEGSVVEIAVHPDYRRQGIARKMLTRVLAECDEINAVYLEVRESNSPAVALYESLGFEKLAVRRNYYDKPTEDAVIYRLPMEPPASAER